MLFGVRKLTSSARRKHPPGFCNVPIRSLSLSGSTVTQERVQGGLPRAARRVVPARSASGATCTRFMAPTRDSRIAGATPGEKNRVRAGALFHRFSGLDAPGSRLTQKKFLVCKTQGCQTAPPRRSKGKNPQQVHLYQPLRKFIEFPMRHGSCPNP